MARTTWRGAHLSVDVGELEGYYRYFLPDGADPEYDFLLETCRDASTFFDVGANQGLYALAIATACPQLRVTAFEPDPRLAAMIHQNCRLNASVQDRVTIEEAAVAERSGTLAFAQAAGPNSGTGRITASDGNLSVRAIALADYIRQTAIQPQVLKIDVEGAELEVLRGLHEFVAVPRAILIELHPDAFSGTDQSRYKRTVVDSLRKAPFNWRFLIAETAWVDALDPSSAWASRIHAFGTRRG